jgi:hypothetical protein
MEVSTRKINSYTTEVKINNEVVYLTDKKKREKSLRRTDRIDKVVTMLAYIIGIAGFLFLVGVPGHGDFCIEMGIADTWSFRDYLLRIVFSASLIGMAYGLYHVVDRVEDRFE